MKFVVVALFLALAAPSTAFVNPASRSSVQLNHQTSTHLGAMNTHDLEKMKESLSNLALASVISLSLLSGPLPAMADGQTEKFKLPPIDFNDKTRCSLSSSTIGQANAARDKLYDLRQCKLSGASAPGFDLSGVIMTDTDVSKANFKEAYFSKGYLQSSNFDGADFTNAIVDRASFKGSSLRGAIFQNAVLTGTTFDGADLEGADFTEAAIGSFDIKGICKNPTLKGENPVTGADSRLSAGCIPSS